MILFWKLGNYAIFHQESRVMHTVKLTDSNSDDRDAGDGAAHIQG